MKMPEMWETKITKIKPNEIRVRGYRLDELMGQVTFSEAIYLLFTGELPDKKIARLLDAIFISSIDHGVSPPSAQAAIISTSTGAPLNAAVAAGILSINDYHGGAIHNCMNVLQSAIEGLKSKDGIDSVANEVVEGFLQSKNRMPGIGHRVHTDDPRTKKLFELASNAGVAAEGVAMINAIAGAFERRGKILPINVDGAIAAILVDLDLPAELANAFFMIARMPGLCAHAYEEKTTQKPMRYIQISFHTYSGHEDREIEERK
jgi:citrate synthase